MLKLLAYLLLMVPLSSLAQIYEDFSDGDFTSEPRWFGTESLFVVNASYQLQLNAESAGDASLYCDYDFTSGVETGEFEWRFWLREAFAPSGNNYSDVYLCDKYFVRFGEVGSADVVDLLRVDGDATVSVCRGHDNFIASSFSAFFKVTRDETGKWTIFVDKDGLGYYNLEAQGVDDTYEPAGNFGIKIKHTAGNAKKVYFDDIYAGQLIIDNEDPCLDSVSVLNYNKLKLRFTEPVDELYALDAVNYSVDNQMESPMYAEYYGNDRSSIILSYSKTIEEGVSYTLTICRIQDLSGNITEDIQYTFIYYDVHENDVVINEIMADPEPQVGLPSWEYIELFNTTNHDISLKNWIVQIGNNERTINQDIHIHSKGFIILCKEDAIASLSEYGDCVGFSSFSIPNSGSLISLTSTNFKKVHKLIFSSYWYRDDAKSDGGWSLEQIDPYSPCLGAENWRASCDTRGGTPGALNSVDDYNFIAPDIDYVEVVSPNSIKVFFNQSMDIHSLENTDNYTIVEFNSHPYITVPSQDDNRSVTLTFSQILVFGLYNILVSGSSNCSGIPVLDGCGCVFGVPDEAEGGDVVINEILFDPISPAADYVEIYNKSDKVIDISELKLGVMKTSFPNPPDTTIKEITSEHRQLFPKQYLLLTTTPDVIGAQYNCSTKNFITARSFPSYPNGGAGVLLLSGNDIIDVMNYSEDSHYPLLAETKGVSLERVSPEISSLDPENWHSAAAPLYGTPGYQNSVFIENTENKTDVEITPAIFSPDGDGYNDATTINLSVFDTDYTAKIMILDSRGVFVRDLVPGQNIATQNRFVWNGLDDNGKIVPSGIYVVFVEMFDIHGNIKRFKKAVVVAGK